MPVQSKEDNTENHFRVKKESFSLVGDVHELMHYNDYLEWLDPSSFFYDDLNNKIIIAQ